MSHQTHCLIFGGTRGIGECVSRVLLQDNFTVTVVSQTAKSLGAFLDKTSNGKSIGERLHGLQCDVTKEEQVVETIGKARDVFGHPSVLINAAGINKDNLLLKTSVQSMHEVLNTNVIGSMVACKAALRGMIQQRNGCIINIGSVVGIKGNAGQCAYSASKSALVGFTKSLAKEVAAKGVRVNLIAPGFIDTGMTSTLNKKQRQILDTVPLRRLGKPEEVADAVRFLIRATYITGEVLLVDGGLHINI